MPSAPTSYGGTYTYQGSFRPLGEMSRDDTLFKDDDGTGYFVSAANNNADLHIYKLTADYTGIDSLVANPWPGAFREAPALFKRGGVYFPAAGTITGAGGGPYYTFVAGHSGRCVDVKDNSAADSYDVVQYDCNGGLNQQWRLKATDSGYVQIIAEHSGKCLDVANGSGDPGAYVQQYHCTTGTNQQWLLEDQGNGSYHLKSRNSNLCLDVANGSTANGARLIQWTCSSTAANQQFQRRTV
ncbi:RICIN domain-containing protein [Streptomyces sp. NPDC056373]|uniref:RICIN domain-containing protein n=1 Tax=Streptomyces sp. NPDC056373 TaxID=3345798 RepID=UPI0035D81BB8